MYVLIKELTFLEILFNENPVCVGTIRCPHNSGTSASILLLCVAILLIQMKYNPYNSRVALNKTMTIKTKLANRIMIFCGGAGIASCGTHNVWVQYHNKLIRTAIFQATSTSDKSIQFISHGSQNIYAYCARTNIHTYWCVLQAHTQTH